MPKILTADTAIQALEEIVISPSSAMITPTLGVVVATESDKTKADWSYLRQIKKFADKYGAEVQVFDVDTTNDAYRAIAEMRDDAKFDGIIIISTFLNGNDQYLFQCHLTSTVAHLSLLDIWFVTRAKHFTDKPLAPRLPFINC